MLSVQAPRSHLDVEKHSLRDLRSVIGCSCLQPTGCIHSLSPQRRIASAAQCGPEQYICACCNDASMLRRQRP